MSTKDFKCPKCGSSFFNTTVNSPWSVAQGACKGPNSDGSCDFTWFRQTTDKYVFVEKEKRSS